jgi:Holliday junction resolvase RusA-like endonuclease
MNIEFYIPGRAIPKARPRVTRGGYAYTPRTTQIFEQTVQTEYRKQCGTESFADKVPLIINIEFRFEPAKSWPKKKRDAAIARRIYPTCRPDLDNLVKSITDALNGIAYKDDSQIVAIVSRKMYAPRANTIVRITSI